MKSRTLSCNATNTSHNEGVLAGVGQKTIILFESGREIMRVLFVCLGNICRSPAAEVIVSKYKTEWKIRSAGISSWHVGHPPDMRAQAEGLKRGYDMSQMRARQFNAGDFYAYDIIYAMDRKVREHIENMRPEDTATRVELFLGDKDVPDPYYTNGFKGVFDMIENRAPLLR